MKVKMMDKIKLSRTRFEEERAYEIEGRYLMDILTYALSCIEWAERMGIMSKGQREYQSQIRAEISAIKTALYI